MTAPVPESVACQVLLGTFFARLRERAGRSQGELAKALGVAQSSVSRMEIGEIALDERTALGWLAVCGVAPVPLNERLDGAWVKARGVVERTFPQQGLFSEEGAWWDRPMRELGVSAMRGLFVFAVEWELGENPLPAAVPT